MTITIVEDEVIIAYHLKKILENNNFVVKETVHNFANGLDALDNGSSAFILDIRLGEGESGIELGEKLALKNIPFIYITAYNELDVLKKAVTSAPSAYISKPFKQRDVLAAVELIKIQQLKNEIEINSTNGMEIIDIKDILFCMASDVYVEVHCTSKKIITRSSLKGFQSKLNENFVQIHDSYVVNKQQITIRKSEKLFIGEIELPISRTFKNSFKI